MRGITRAYFGAAGDLPVPGDYDGDGSAEIAIFRGGAGLWAVRGVTRAYYGLVGDFPVPGEYDGDGSAGIAVFRGATGLWAVRGGARVTSGQPGICRFPGTTMAMDPPGSPSSARRPDSGQRERTTRIYFGRDGDRQAGGDYDGDGSVEIAVSVPGPGALWAIRKLTRIYFGTCLDRPVPADYRGNGTDTIGVFRGPSGLWAVRGMTRMISGPAPTSRLRDKRGRLDFLPVSAAPHRFRAWTLPGVLAPGEQSFSGDGGRPPTSGSGHRNEIGIFRTDPLEITDIQSEQAVGACFFRGPGISAS